MFFHTFKKGHKIQIQVQILGFSNRFESANVCRKYFYAKPEDFQNKHIAFIMTQNRVYHFEIVKLDLKYIKRLPVFVAFLYLVRFIFI
jgi:predicted acyl esterase